MGAQSVVDSDCGGNWRREKKQPGEKNENGKNQHNSTHNEPAKMHDYKSLIWQKKHQTDRKQLHTERASPTTHVNMNHARARQTKNTPKDTRTAKINQRKTRQTKQQRKQNNFLPLNIAKKQLEHQEKSATESAYTHLINLPAQTNHQLTIARWATKQDNTQTLCCPKHRCQQGKLF